MRRDVLVESAILLLLGLATACIKTSTYYRSQFRTQTHVFVPDEYRPMQPERSLEASGPLETQDFHLNIPTSRLVRVEGPHLQFASEEARWMTKGCRDRLQKLASIIQNTWPNNDVALRVLDGWIRPPPNIQRQSKVMGAASAAAAAAAPSNPGYPVSRHRQPLKMTVPEDLADLNVRRHGRQTNAGYQTIGSVGGGTNSRSVNSLGFKAASPDTRVMMQHPRLNATRYRGKPWQRPETGVVGFESPPRHPSYIPAMMEEFHYAGRALDMVLVDPRNQRHNSLYSGKLAQLAYYGALFDWCYFSRLGHVHCSVKPDSIITSQWFGCFPGSAIALSANGTPKRLSHLRIGDRVMTLSPDLQSMRPTTVVAFLHRDQHQFSPWVEISFSGDSSRTNSTLRVTANHLIYRFKNTKSAVYAADIKSGDLIACRPDFLCRVNNIRVVNSTLLDYGVYAPLTASGNLIVDGVFVSCFAEFKDEFLARLATIPLYLKHHIFEDFQFPSGIHYYAQWLLRVGRFLLPEHLFFSRY